MVFGKGLAELNVVFKAQTESKGVESFEITELVQNVLDSTSTAPYGRLQGAVVL